MKRGGFRICAKWMSPAGDTFRPGNFVALLQAADFIGGARLARELRIHAPCEELDRPDATVGNIRLSNEVVNEQMERTMILSKKEHIHNVARVASAGVLVLGLAACDQIQSLWKTEKDAGPTASNPVTQTGQAAQPVEPKIELAKAPETSKAAAPVSEDAALAAKVKSALRAEPALKKSTVDIGTSGGVVTLYGTADTRANRERATQVASNVPGVKSVKNEMVVVSGS